ncbi:MAG: bifunctional 2-C-methyl-D-erythritol 4-phosphate cytidylyltransferase/2-C-methyl-D-erythritol 2,4-cyclodiphosphate synthase [Hyphomonadaceae bacterium]|nr:bifunctional 2-C-methyl-D-erythritol 4-phosphate cytidylyltransferase/2-C-methyl-D-erythritol 2,4-cyclodiphosphate synthase [Hyphomonadaceae bacterium]
MTVSAIIVAAGRGERMGGDPKQYRLIGRRPVIDWSVAAFRASGVNDVIVVTAPDQREHTGAFSGRHPDIRVVVGGETRADSVRAGLAAVGNADKVLIHDAARPGLTPAVVHALLAALEQGAVAVAPALPVSDTLVRADENWRITADIDRAGAMRVQTPQAFRFDLLKRAHETAVSLGRAFTDDLSVMSSAGYSAQLIEGSPLLHKITHAGDFAMMEQLLTAARITCVGHGVDAHRFGAGDHVMLCGVRIEHDQGLIGHSDADAGWHALVDAILGALGEGDIGAHFPPSDLRWKGASSEVFLRHAGALAKSADARINHVDVTLICERPKITPHREAMRRRTADVLGVPIERVSIKATTTERMGFTGRGEGLAAQATATLDRLP